jgi:hypothetical protein
LNPDEDAGKEQSQIYGRVNLPENDDDDDDDDDAENDAVARNNDERSNARQLPRDSRAIKPPANLVPASSSLSNNLARFVGLKIANE